MLAQQDTSLVDKNHKFKDGLYFNFQEFQSDQPTYTWDKLEAKAFTNPITKLTYVDSVIVSSTQVIRTDSVWGICLGGIPYVNINKETDAGLHIFAALRSRGRICYLEFQDKKIEEKTMRAYNPLTRQPFREASIKKEVEVIRRFMLHFINGRMIEFNKENLQNWIEEDKQLARSVAKLDDQDHQNLFKSLLIFCDRNPVNIPLKD